MRVRVLHPATVTVIKQQQQQQQQQQQHCSNCTALHCTALQILHCTAASHSASLTNLHSVPAAFFFSRFCHSVTLTQPLAAAIHCQLLPSVVTLMMIRTFSPLVMFQLTS
jgi:hypothetical protein